MQGSSGCALLDARVFSGRKRRSLHEDAFRVLSGGSTLAGSRLMGYASNDHAEIEVSTAGKVAAMWCNVKCFANAKTIVVNE